jgi:predicted MFS family arabinose efflux permease
VFQAPVRLLFALRPKVPAGVLVATAVSTAVFAATPFLVKGVAVDHEVSIGTVGLISTAQLAGFMIASWGAGRLLRPRRAVMVIAVLVGLAANVGSGLAPWFTLLVGARFVSGIALGLVSWIAWAEAFGDSEKVGDVAVIGPIVGTVSAPLIAIVIDESGTDLLFFVLGGLYLLPLLFVRGLTLDAAKSERQERHRPTRAAAAILVCLGLLTFGGSAVFVFAGVIGQDDVGISPFTVSLVFSANALAAIPSARYRGTRHLPGIWILAIATAAILLSSVHSPIVFWIALPVWGFSFWMATPAAFALLAERSNFPAERAGDAQAVMAAGRMLGPLLGGALYVISPSLLGAVSGAILAIAGITMLYIERRIHPETLALRTS